MFRSREWIAFYRDMIHKSFTVVDLETTGRVDPKNRVIEVSILKATLQEGILNQRTTLINPEIKVPPSIALFTGIKQTMVDQAPVAEQVWPSLYPDLNQGILMGHNLSFDYTFLQLEFQRLGLRFHRSAEQQLCTVALARLMLSELPSRSLPALVKHFGFQVGPAHRAESDTLACWLVAERLLNDIQQLTDEQLLNRFGQQWIPLKIAAGILHCTLKQARTQLKKANVPYRATRSGKYLYRRYEVEQLDTNQPPSLFDLL